MSLVKKILPLVAIGALALGVSSCNHNSGLDDEDEPTEQPPIDQPAPDYSAEKEVIRKAADRLVATQNNDGGWEWQNPDTDPATGTSAKNTFGITGLGALNAYQVLGDSKYLNAAKKTGDTLVARSNDSFYSQDIEFLALLGKATGSSSYTNKAKEVMNHFMNEDNKYDEVSGDGCTAAELAAKYASVYPDNDDRGLTEWQLASWVRAARLTGNESWAEDMINEMNADIANGYFDINNAGETHIIGLAGIVSEVGNSSALERLLALQKTNGSWDSANVEGSAQDTAYSVLALDKRNKPSNVKSGSDYLVSSRNSNDSWGDDKASENTENTGEAIQAIVAYISE